jgi:hypothetical protein
MMSGHPGGGQLVELSRDECLGLLRQAAVGRVGVVVDGFAVIVPVAFELVGDDDQLVIVIRTRAGSAADRAAAATFQVDAIDGYHRAGWSVLVRAVVDRQLGDAGVPPGRADVVPWVSGRDSCLVLRAVGITGRRLEAADVELPNLGAYL